MRVDDVEDEVHSRYLLQASLLNLGERAFSRPCLCPLLPFLSVQYSTHSLIAQCSTGLFEVRSSMLHRPERVLTVDSGRCQVGTRRRQLGCTQHILDLIPGIGNVLQGREWLEVQGQNSCIHLCSLSCSQVQRMQAREFPRKRYQKPTRRPHVSIPPNPSFRYDACLPKRCTQCLCCGFPCPSLSARLICSSLKKPDLQTTYIGKKWAPIAMGVHAMSLPIGLAAPRMRAKGIFIGW